VSTSKSEDNLTPAQIAALQAAMGLSLSQFALSLSVSRDTVVKWKAGRATPRLRKPLRILRRLMKEWGIE
jgi:DNA-binding transcriptional regulator YiaG